MHSYSLFPHPRQSSPTRFPAELRHSLTRRSFLAHATKAAAFAFAAPAFAKSHVDEVGKPFKSERREIKDPETGRRIIQLTSGDCFDHPLYYFDPTFASDGKTIVFYRYDPASGEIQLYKIHIDSGETVRLTQAKTKNSLWRAYVQPPGFGVRELMSAVTPLTDEATYFDTNELRAVNVHTYADRLVARVPEGRAPSGLTGVSPNGRFLCYPYYDQTDLPPLSVIK